MPRLELGWISLACLACVACPAVSRAQPRGRIVVLATQTPDSAGDARADDRLHSALEQIDGLDLGKYPAIDLETAELAIDCVDESPRCLRAIAERLGAQVLLAPLVEVKGGQAQLTILYYDVSGDGSRRSVVRGNPGTQLSAETNDAIPAMVRELLALPEEIHAEESHAEPAPLPAPDGATPAVVTPSADLAPQSEAGGSRLPLGPVILASAGVLMAGTGVVFVAMMHDTERDYQRRSVLTESDAREAHAAIELGERQALIANTLLVAGASAVVLSGIWLALALSSDDAQSPSALAPSIGPEYAGLSLSGAWEGL